MWPKLAAQGIKLAKMVKIEGLILSKIQILILWNWQNSKSWQIWWLKVDQISNICHSMFYQKNYLSPFAIGKNCQKSNDKFESLIFSAQIHFDQNLPCQILSWGFELQNWLELGTSFSCRNIFPDILAKILQFLHQPRKYRDGGRELKWGRKYFVKPTL